MAGQPLVERELQAARPGRITRGEAQPLEFRLVLVVRRGDASRDRGGRRPDRRGPRRGGARRKRGSVVGEDRRPRGHVRMAGQLLPSTQTGKHQVGAPADLSVVKREHQIALDASERMRRQDQGDGGRCSAIGVRFRCLAGRDPFHRGRHLGSLVVGDELLAGVAPRGGGGDLGIHGAEVLVRPGVGELLGGAELRPARSPDRPGGERRQAEQGDRKRACEKAPPPRRPGPRGDQPSTS
jgi:hypothetical protein